jgi:hypothetical protein
MSARGLHRLGEISLAVRPSGVSTALERRNHPAADDRGQALPVVFSERPSAAGFALQTYGGSTITSATSEVTAADHPLAWRAIPILVG